MRIISFAFLFFTVPYFVDASNPECAPAKSPEDSLNVAACLVTKDKWGQAAVEVHRFRQNYPLSLPGALLETRVLLRLKRYAAAREIVERDLAAHPESPEALILSARLYRDLSQPVKEEAVLLQWTERTPRDPNAWKNLGDFYLNRSSEKALDSFERAEKLRREDGQNWTGMAEAHLRLGDTASASREFERAANLNRTAGQGNSRIDLLYGDFLRETADYTRSIAEYDRAIKIDPKSSEAYLGKARSYIKLGENHRALQALAVCVKDPEWKLEALNFMLKVYQTQGDTKRAADCNIEIARVSAEQLHRDAAGSEVASNLTEAGKLFQEKNFADAKAMYRSIADSHPEVAEAYEGMARCAFATGDNPAAETSIRKSLSLEEKASAHVFLGRVLLTENKIEEARTEFRMAKDADPSGVEGPVGLAACEIAGHRFPAAIGILRGVIKLPDPEFHAGLMLTEALYKNGERDEALNEVDRILKARPNYPVAQAMRAALLKQ